MVLATSIAENHKFKELSKYFFLSSPSFSSLPIRLEELRLPSQAKALVTRAFPSPSAHTFDGEAPSAQASGPSLALCLA